MSDHYERTRCQADDRRQTDERTDSQTAGVVQQSLTGGGARHALLGRQGGATINAADYANDRIIVVVVASELRAPNTRLKRSETKASALL